MMMEVSRPPEYRSEEHTSELQSLCVISYAVLCLKKKKLPGDHDRRRELPRQVRSAALHPHRRNSLRQVRRAAGLRLPGRPPRFFLNDPPTTEIYTTHNTLSLHGALPIFIPTATTSTGIKLFDVATLEKFRRDRERSEEHTSELQSLCVISYAVFCLK